MYHKRKSITGRKWKQGDTAKYFGISNALVSENIKLIDNMGYDALKEYKSRHGALNTLKDTTHED